MRKMMFPMMVVLLLQSCLFVGTIIFGGTVEQLNRNSFDILNERVINRKNYIENEMLQRWTNIGDAVQMVNEKASSILAENGMTVGDLYVGSQETADILDSVSQTLIYTLRRQSVTGAFVVLNGQDDPNQTYGTTKSGIYLRDMNAHSNAGDNSDLLIERASSSITQKLGISMDTGWKPQFQFSTDMPEASYDFFYKPFRAAFAYPGTSYSDLGYWSRPFQLNEDDVSVITYSVPLLCDGVPYGVFGIEVSVDYLKSLLPYDEIAADKAGSYLLAIGDEGELAYENVLASGPVFKQLYGDQKTLRMQKHETYGNSRLIERNERSKTDIYGCVQYFKLYNSNTPFESDRWALIGMVQENKLLGFSHKVEMTVGISIVISIAAGLLIVLISSRIVTNPITQLARKVKESDPHRPVHLDKTRIVEIDQLASAVESLSDSVAESASKLSKIVEMTSTAIGAFEINQKEGRTFYTERLFEILGLDDSYQDNGFISNRAFFKKIREIEKSLEQEQTRENVWLFKIQRETEYRWVSIKLAYDEERILGVAEDVTQEIVEKKKIEYERDYDLLTNLINRRAFYTALTELFLQPEKLKTAAMMMFDLDNLKYINDTYGHDYGDKYIRCTAQILKKYTPDGAVVSRMSGDEFYIFLYGYDGKDEILSIIDHLRQGLAETAFPLPDNASFRVRASAGIAWYPDDTDSYEQLIRYADFAMYTVKHTVKGQFMQFNIEEYQKESYLLHNKEELNKFIDGQLVEYHFQPIVDAVTGEIFAYEALMRSKLESLKSPMEILNLAKSQSKLYEIERLTWFRSMADFVKQKQIPDNVHIFINSIANQILSPEDFEEFQQRYQPYLDRIVMELTEEEKQNSSYADSKQECIRLWNASLALDDFGMGYNGEAMLLTLTPHYVKIDMSIVRDIDTDKNRQKILQNLLSYTKERKIKVIAEGVETQGEMETLIQTGVDFMQGYYIGIPQKTAQKIDPRIVMQIQQLNSKLKS